MVAILCVFFVLGQARAENIKKICIMPFDVHAGDQSGNLQESFYNHLVKEFQKEKTIEVLRAGILRGAASLLQKARPSLQEKP